jgi:nucleotide-binding universal stress UspA family protein
MALNKVLVATDLSVVSSSALRFAQAISRRYDSKLFVTNVVSPVESAWVPPEYWVSSEQIEQVVRQQMDKLKAKL